MFLVFPRKKIELASIPGFLTRRSNVLQLYTVKVDLHTETGIISVYLSHSDILLLI